MASARNVFEEGITKIQSCVINHVKIIPNVASRMNLCVHAHSKAALENGVVCGPETLLSDGAI